MKQIAVAMSGGVDSTACALLLRERFDVYGLLMDIGQPGFDAQVEQVGTIAETLGIAWEIVDLKRSFEQIVLHYFTTSYAAGRTPNPCMICNRDIKCGLLLDRLKTTGADQMATGHYVTTREVDGEIGLFRGADPVKDQSYFLARLSGRQLAHVHFPLGNMVKEETYRLVEAHGFSGFRGNESQDVCFLKDTSVADYLHSRLNAPDRDRRGPIVTMDGTEIGTHDGLHRYTIGQRRGLGLPDQSPWYVRQLDAGQNRLVVCKGDELFSTGLEAGKLNWLIAEPPCTGSRFTAKIRSTHHGTPCTIASCEDQQLVVTFDEAQRAVTPGQFIVFYDGDRVIGSAEITGPLTPDRL